MIQAHSKNLNCDRRLLNKKEKCLVLTSLSKGTQLFLAGRTFVGICGHVCIHNHFIKHTIQIVVQLCFSYYLDLFPSRLVQIDLLYF